MDLRTEMLNIYEANYPETLRRIFIINGINELCYIGFVIEYSFEFKKTSTETVHYHLQYHEAIHESGDNR